MIRLTSLILATSLLSTPALASDEIIREEMDWIAAETGLPVPPAVPQIRYRSLIGLSRLYLGADYSVDTPITIEALYNWGTIFVPYGTELFTTQRHILVHELVHHMQAYAIFLGERSFLCVGAMEPEAYEVQAKWQDENDDPNPRPNMLTAYILATCGAF